MSQQLFAADFKAKPYWWDRTPRPEPGSAALPKEADVAIIGSGYTGLNAAIQTARGGRQTVVLDAEAAGWGCSSRNGGQISTSIKPSYAELVQAYGEKTGYEVALEGHRALAWLGEFIAAEDIDCDFAVCGRFMGAHSARQYDRMGRNLVPPAKGLETNSYLVPRAEQQTEIGSDFYHGGLVHPKHAALDPGRYHQGLYRAATEAGAKVVAHCKVTGINREGAQFELDTAKGRLRARAVIVATSGYTGSFTPWLQRRIIPIGSYMLATEPLGRELIDEFNPKGRVITDTRKLVVYYRTCPERQRILFGGRVSISETDARAAAPALHDEMVKIYPQLAATPMTHAWMGFVGYTFNALPHLGVHDGVHYAMGYCGSGVSLASYLGMRIGQKVLGLNEGRSALEDTAFVSRPYYFGWPWFLVPSIRYYRWKDARG